MTSRTSAALDDDPARLGARSVEIRRAALGTGALTGDVDRARSALGVAWSGPAATACVDELARAARLLSRLELPLATAQTQLRAYAAVVEEARGATVALERAEAGVQERRRAALATAYAGAGVSGPVRGLHAELVTGAYDEETAALRRRRAAVLDDVAADARRRAHVLRAASDGVTARSSASSREAALVSGLPLLAQTRRAAGDVRPPPPGAPAELVRAWWRVLTPDERDRALTGARHVRHLAGLPATARSRANERWLHGRVATLQALPGRSREQTRELASARQVLASLRDVRATTDPATGGRRTAQLLVVGPNAFGGQGRVSIAVGDLDTAAHVAVLVPGMGSDLRDSTAALTRDAVAVADAGHAADPGAATAVVAWVGYDAPEWHRVASGRAAEAGAVLLAADLVAMQAARDDAPHLTVVGHSYGATTAAVTVRDHPTGADAVVLAGSPGAAVEQVDELGMPEGQVYVVAADHDPVSALDWFGADPSHERFGAVRLPAGTGCDPGDPRGPVDLRAHSDYYRPGSPSLRSIAGVVVGEGDTLPRAPYREERPRRPDWEDCRW